MDSLREATQRMGAAENRMLAAGMLEQPSYRNLFVRVSGALAMTERPSWRRGVGGVCKKLAKRAGASLGLVEPILSSRGEREGTQRHCGDLG
jgi:hypothetical protein